MRALQRVVRALQRRTRLALGVQLGAQPRLCALPPLPLLRDHVHDIAARERGPLLLDVSRVAEALLLGASGTEGTAASAPNSNCRGRRGHAA